MAELRTPTEENPHVWFRYAVAFVTQADRAKLDCERYDGLVASLMHIPACFLLAHGAELTLKTWILCADRAYRPERDGHDLERLFSRARERGFPAASEDVAAIERLSQLARSPIRFQGEEKAHRVTFPMRYPGPQFIALGGVALRLGRDLVGRALADAATRLPGTITPSPQALLANLDPRGWRR